MTSPEEENTKAQRKLSYLEVNIHVQKHLSLPREVWIVKNLYFMKTSQIEPLSKFKMPLQSMSQIWFSVSIIFLCSYAQPLQTELHDRILVGKSRM